MAKAIERHHASLEAVNAARAEPPAITTQPSGKMFRFHRRLVYWNFLILLLVVFVPGGGAVRSGLALIVGFVLTLFASHMLKLRVANPLSELLSMVHRVSEGDLEQRAPIKGDADVLELLRGVNSLTRKFESAEKDLRDRLQKAESFLQAMVEGVMILDSSGRITFNNRSVRKMMGTDRDLLGKTTLDLFRDPQLEANVRTVLTGGPSTVVDLALPGSRSAQAHIAGVPNLAGAVDSAVVVFHDLTEVRNAERMRRDFVANVSHEFKTPLTAIRGYTETLLGGALEDPRTATDFLRIVERNARHLESLVSDLLTLARLEAELPASLETIHVKSLVDEQISLRQAAIRERNLHVTADCGDIELNVDRVRLVTAVSNLVDNAVHYNRPSGEIRITAATENGFFVLSIADTGEGIPSSDLQRIFERFYRVDKARTRASGGTGLGLAIVKHAIESQGGSISVSSKLGVGSKFSIRLPIRRP
jgi:two-component system phosphate regulon sensor histidine kinase PhoR